MAAAKNSLLRAARSFSSTPPFHPIMPIQMWWDINTYVPDKGGVKATFEDLTKGLRQFDFQSPVRVEAFGDTELLCAETRKELADAVKVVNHVPAGVEVFDNGVAVARFGKFFLEILPPACHYFLLSDEDVLRLVFAFKKLGYTAMHAVQSLASAVYRRPPF